MGREGAGVLSQCCWPCAVWIVCMLWPHAYQSWLHHYITCTSAQMSQWMVVHLLVSHQMAVLQLMFCHAKCMVSTCPLFWVSWTELCDDLAHLPSQYARMFVCVCVCTCVSVCVKKQLTPLIHVWHINKQSCVLDCLQLTATVSCFWESMSAGMLQARERHC